MNDQRYHTDQRDTVEHVSHRVRTHMTTIIGMTELVLESAGDAKHADYLNIVRRSGTSLLTMLDDIMDYLKTDSYIDIENVSTFSLRDLLGEMVKKLSAEVANPHLEVACHIMPGVVDFVRGDANILRRIIWNLVNNAIKFTAEGRVVIQVATNENNDAGRRDLSDTCNLCFSVIDSGSGIPPQLHAKVFQPFYQNYQLTDVEPSGTGLGLTIASRLVESIGGRIWIESPIQSAGCIVASGTAVHFTARFQNSHDIDMTSTITAEMARISESRVLIVDDDPLNRQILAEILSSWKMNPRGVESAAAALEELEYGASSGKPYQLAFIDSTHTATGGYRLAKEIKHSGTVQSTKLLMMTDADDKQVLRYYQSGIIDGHIRKPLTHAELYRLFKNVLTTSGRRPTSNFNRNDAALASVPAGLPRQPLRILLVEDNRFHQKLTATLLEKEGHTVTSACDGTSALELLEETTFNLIIMDICLPDIDGLETAAAVRKRELLAGQYTPIVAFTVRVNEDVERRFCEAGIDDYVSKPIKIDELRMMLSDIAAPKASPVL